MIFKEYRKRKESDTIFETGQTYKIETIDNIFYTGKVTSIKDNPEHVMIDTIKGEVILLNLKEIKRAMKLK